MKLIKTAAAALVLAFALALPVSANAANESLEASFSLEPQSGQFLNNGFKPANWEVANTVSVPPGEPEILPSKVIDIGNPKGEMTFNPGNMPVCGPQDIGPGLTSVPADVMVARCPDSVLGNGTAQFAFNRIPTVLLNGQIIAFNGGLKNGLPLVKVYAYSYDTNVGIYTEGVLDNNGRLKFEVEQLTADSAVTTLNLAIPGKRQVLTGVDPGGDDVILPKGVKSNYVQAKCSTGQHAWDSKFTHGTRDSDNVPTSPDTFTMDSGSEPCTGVTGKAKLAAPKVNGPNRVKLRKTTVYKVKVRNTGQVTAKQVRLRVAGRGVKVNLPVGQVAAGKTRTVRVRARFVRRGKVKASFRLTSKNAGSKTVRRTIRVR